MSEVKISPERVSQLEFWASRHLSGLQMQYIPGCRLKKSTMFGIKKIHYELRLDFIRVIQERARRKQQRISRKRPFAPFQLQRPRTNSKKE